MAEKNEKEIKVKSLQKALDILNCFTKKSSWGVTELSEYLDLNKSNVHSILSTFAAMEYLRQDEETGKYRLGMAIYTLCHALGDELIVGNIALPYMGERARMYCTGLGKAMMAYLPEKEVEEYLRRELPACTDYTITDAEKLKEELILTRKRGYAIDNMEHEFGVKCVAMPIFNQQHQVEAAISVSGPSLRFEEERIQKIAEKLKDTVRKIERRL